MSAAVLGPTGSLESLTDDLLRSVQSPPKWTLYALAASFVGTIMLFAAVTYTITTGVGTWGNNIPNAWCFGITNFVWWIGIGHAGTFISAFLLLLEQKWRASINRFAEAMTLFAVAQAGLYPLLHLGRPWFFYWLIPYPSTTTAWPQFRSALTWDVVAVSTYLAVSFLFWYLGLIPDLATLRDRAKTLRKRKIYALFALGWTGSSTAWQRWRIGYGLLAGVATPLVVSVHSVVSADFASANLPGWHSTLFPPFFVAGAIFSGFAMVLTLMIPARKIYKLQHIITPRHLDNIAKMLLVTGWIVTYSYAFEIITAWYSKDPFDHYVHLEARLYGVFAPYFWTTVFCNCIAPQILWSKKIRTNPTVLFVLSLVIQLGMWMERFLLIVTSQSRDFLPSSWRPYHPTLVDFTLLGGTMCFFVFLFTLFLRYIPFVPISEVKHLRHEIEQEEKAGAELLANLVAAEFESADAVVAAAGKVRALGYAKIEAYTPFPIVELDEALKRPRPTIPRWAFIGGLTGMLSALLIQWWMNAYDYPVIIGGRPMASWPTYVIIMFEATVLGTAFTAFFAVILGSKMPRLHDPIFDLPNFERASVDRFFLTIGDLGKRDKAELREALVGAVAIHGAAS